MLWFVSARGRAQQRIARHGASHTRPPHRRSRLSVSAIRAGGDDIFGGVLRGPVADGSARKPLCSVRTEVVGRTKPNAERSHQSRERPDRSRPVLAPQSEGSAEVRPIMHSVYQAGGQAGELRCGVLGEMTNASGRLRPSGGQTAWSRRRCRQHASRCNRCPSYFVPAPYGRISRHVPRRMLKRLLVQTNRVVMARSKCSVGAFWLQQGWPSHTGTLAPVIRRPMIEP